MGQVKYSKDQQTFLDTVNRFTKSIIEPSGDPGTGKSLVLKEAIQQHNENGLGVVVTAPTGRAALNIGGVTMHRAFGIRPSHGEPLICNPSRGARGADVIVVDEIGMVHAEMFENVVRALIEIEENRGRNYQIILCGDLAQLPPVIPNVERKYMLQKYGGTSYRHAYIYRELCATGRILGIELSENFRHQGNDKLPLALTNIRNQINLGKTARFLNQRCGGEAQDDAVTLCFTNAQAMTINREMLANHPGKEYVYRSSSVGNVPKDRFGPPAPETIHLKLGIRAMCIKNIYQNGALVLSNGALGTIVHLTDQHIWLLEDGTEAPIKIVREEWSNYRLDVDRETGKPIQIEIGKYVQIPIIPAAACTIHKAQGATFSKVNLVIESGFSRCPGLAYVGLSRVTSLEGLRIIGELRPRHLQIPEIPHTTHQEIPNTKYRAEAIRMLTEMPL